MLLKELQSLGLDVKVYDEDRNEVEIMESVDYTDSDYRVEMEGDNKYNTEEDFEGYQRKEFDAGSGDLVDAEDELEEEDEYDYSEDDFSDDDFGDEENDDFNE